MATTFLRIIPDEGPMPRWLRERERREAERRLRAVPARRQSNFGLSRAFGRLYTLWTLWRRRRSRVALCTLNDRMLKDIGVTRSEAEYEANKWFWHP